MRDCDFIPAGYYQVRAMTVAVRRRASLICGLVAMMAVWFIAHQRQLSTASAMIADISSQHEQAQTHARKRSVMEKERETLARREQLVAELYGPTQSAVILSDLSRRLPESVMLTGLTVSSPGLSKFAWDPDAGLVEKLAAGSQVRKAAPVSAAKKTTNRSQMTLLGIARTPQDVIALAAFLETSPLIDRVQIQSQAPSEWAGRRAEKFEILCDLVNQKGRP